MDTRAHEIEDVYRRRYLALRNSLVPVTGSVEAAREAVQEAFARALRERDSFRGEGTLEAWLWRIAFRVALEPRRNGRVLTLEDAYADVSFEEPERDPELVAALKALPPRRKLIVFLRYFGDLSYAEIAAVCGISEGTVGAALANAHAELLATLGDKGERR